jgi:hypothetical protein
LLLNPLPLPLGADVDGHGAFEAAELYRLPKLHRVGTQRGLHFDRRFGIDAALHHTKIKNGGVGATLIAEAKRKKADLIVMGGYGHSRLREWFLGGLTYNLLHEAPIRLLVAH